MTTTTARKAEIKTRTTDRVKADATDIYSRWGLKSIEVGGLPFNLRIEKPTYEAISAKAYHAELNADGIAVLPSDWNDEDE